MEYFWSLHVLHSLRDTDDKKFTRLVKSVSRVNFRLEHPFFVMFILFLEPLRFWIFIYDLGAPLSNSDFINTIKKNITPTLKPTGYVMHQQV